MRNLFAIVGAVIVLAVAVTVGAFLRAAGALDLDGERG